MHNGNANRPIGWLLASGNPSIRYRTLAGLLNRPSDDTEVAAARAAILDYPPLAALLAAQKAGGYWVQRDYYLPKHSGTFWVLGILADLGLTKANEHVRRGCEHLFAHQANDGQFHRRRRFAGKGLDWETQTEPCNQARIARFLIQFDYGDDPRTRAALQWLLATQRPDAMRLPARHAGFLARRSARPGDRRPTCHGARRGYGLRPAAAP